MPDSLTAVGTWRAMWRLALPVLVEESLTMLVGWTDWWLAGHYLQTAEHKAAMGLLAYLLWLLTSLFAAVSIGATALVARFIGAQNPQSASRVASQAILCGLVLAAVMTVVLWFSGPTLIHWMQLKGQPAELVWQFLRIVIPAIPFIMLEQVGTACLHGAGDTLSGCVAKGLVNVVNMTLSPVLLLGLGFAPKLGWEGLAVGTAAGHVLGGSLILFILIRGRRGVRLSQEGLKPDRELIRRLLRIGIPGGIDMCAVVLCHLTYVSVINTMGTLASAAHGLGLQIEAMSYLPGAAFQVAASTLAGQYLGAGDVRRASRGVLLTCLVGGAIMSSAAVTFFFFGHWLTVFFTGDPADPAGIMAARLLKIVAISTPSLAVLSILTGGLRGAGDTRWPLAITFIGLLGIRIPGACLLAWGQFAIPGTAIIVTGWGLGVAGAWWAMTIDVVVRSLLIAVRFFQGGWRAVKV
jgi:putative MATE family efflux protein